MSNLKNLVVSAGVLGALSFLASDAAAQKRRKMAAEAAAIAALPMALPIPMANLTPQLAKLLEFSGRIAAATHKNGENKGSSTPWLSDCLMGFTALGQHIHDNQPLYAVSMCDDLIVKFRDYRVLNLQKNQRECATMLDEAMAVLTDIREKIIAMTKVAA